MVLLELAKEVGLNPKLESSSPKGSEYSSSCPACGGSDRFRMWPRSPSRNCIGNYWCRKCEKRGDSIQFCRDFLGLSFEDACKRVNAEITLRPSQMSHIEQPFSRPTLIPPNDKWCERALEFVDWANGQLRLSPAKFAKLKSRGLPEDAIERYKLGYCINDTWVSPEEFGLEGKKKIFLPRGIVIPSLEPSGKVTRVKIRRTQWKVDDDLPKYWQLRGSMNGLNIVGSFQRLVMLVVESELDALAAHYACGDIAFCISVGSNTKTPDNVADYWAKRKPYLLICHDNDEGGMAMLAKWQKLYPHARPLPVPIGKDIGEAIEQGLNLNEWFLSNIESS